MNDEAMRRMIADQLEDSASVKKRLADESIEVLVQIASAIRTSLENGGKVILFGNGGSAADAQHIASELVGRFKKDRPGLRAMALSTDTSLLTSVSNDYGFQQVFSRQIECMTDPEDVVIGITTSGNSENILRGLKAAGEIGARTICMTGMEGGSCASEADISLIVPSFDVPRIQEAHITVGHIVCNLVEEELFDDQDG